VLVAVSWAFQRGDPERAALAESYRTLAVYASRLAAGHFGPPSSIAFPATAALADLNPLLPRTARLYYLDLLEQRNASAPRSRPCLNAQLTSPRSPPSAPPQTPPGRWISSQTHCASGEPNVLEASAS
jgi:hypothetical protein